MNSNPTALGDEHENDDQAGAVYRPQPSTHRWEHKPKTPLIWPGKSVIFYLKTGTFGRLLCLIKRPAKARLQGGKSIYVKA